MPLNAVFLYTTPIAKLAGQLDVGLVAGKQIFGDAGGRMVGALICVGLISAISAMMWIGPTRDHGHGRGPRRCCPCSRARRGAGVPAVAILVQADRGDRAVVH